MLFPRFPHMLSDGQLGLMLMVIIPVIFGLFWLYNAYRLGMETKGAGEPSLGLPGHFVYHYCERSATIGS